MAKEFPKYKILDIQPLAEQNENIDFKLRLLNKKQKSIKIFTPKDFKKYREDNDVNIVGNIRKRQRRYDNYLDDVSLRKEKRKKNIIGQARLLMPNDVKGTQYITELPNDTKYKYYDVREANKVHTIGYAWVGDNKFLRVTAFNPLFLLLPIFLALLIALVIMLLPQDVKDNIHIDIEPNNPVTEDKPNTNKPKTDLWYFAPFDETTVLTEDNKEIILSNLAVNEGKWLCSYQIMVDGKTIHTTGAILPSNVVAYDLWSKLDAGTYKLVCRSTEYDYTTHEAKGGHYDITTNLVIKK